MKSDFEFLFSDLCSHFNNKLHINNYNKASKTFLDEKKLINLQLDLYTSTDSKLEIETIKNKIIHCFTSDHINDYNNKKENNKFDGLGYLKNLAYEENNNNALQKLNNDANPFSKQRKDIFEIKMFKENLKSKRVVLNENKLQELYK